MLVRCHQVLLLITTLLSYSFFSFCLMAVIWGGVYLSLVDQRCYKFFSTLPIGKWVMFLLSSTLDSSVTALTSALWCRWCWGSSSTHLGKDWQPPLWPPGAQSLRGPCCVEAQTPTWKGHMERERERESERASCLRPVLSCSDPSCTSCFSLDPRLQGVAVSLYRHGLFWFLTSRLIKYNNIFLYQTTQFWHRLSERNRSPNFVNINLQKQEFLFLSLSSSFF